MKYKVGDKVRINKNLTENSKKDIVGGMFRYAGEEATVADVDSISERYSLDVDEEGWWWSDEMLE